MLCFHVFFLSRFVPIHTGDIARALLFGVSVKKDKGANRKEINERMDESNWL
jgi:hypothetical protein